MAKRIGFTLLQLLVTAAGIYYVFHDPQKRAEIGQSLGGIKENESRRLLVNRERRARRASRTPRCIQAAGSRRAR